jgi:hypothetical protein
LEITPSANYGQPADLDPFRPLRDFKRLELDADARMNGKLKTGQIALAQSTLFGAKSQATSHRSAKTG